MQVTRRGRTNRGRIYVEVEQLRYERRRRSGKSDLLDTPGNLHLRGLAEFQLVEHIAGDLRVLVRIQQSVERTTWVVRAWRRQFLMTALEAKCGRHAGEARVERHHLNFEATFLLFVAKYLPDPQRGWIRGIGEIELVVFVVGRAGPEPDRFDRRAVRPILPLGGELGLMAINSRLVIGPIDARNAVKRIVLRDRSTDEAALEDIGAA